MAVFRDLGSSKLIERSVTELPACGTEFRESGTPAGNHPDRAHSSAGHTGYESCLNSMRTFPGTCAMVTSSLGHTPASARTPQ